MLHFICILVILLCAFLIFISLSYLAFIYFYFSFSFSNFSTSALTISNTTRIPEMLGHFLNLNKIKTKRISNHTSQYFIHNRT